ncbi:MAG: hypothetical protein Ct9H300mP12_13660 [Acidimicrobiales bacterium]|nr:MAG: hypothetical protein Ct9H300mP12_13660 [Acidimicrobiales bacterium]
MASALGARYISDMDRLFDVYADMVREMNDFFGLESRSLRPIRTSLPTGGVSQGL